MAPHKVIVVPECAGERYLTLSLTWVISINPWYVCSLLIRTHYRATSFSRLYSWNMFQYLTQMPLVTPTQLMDLFACNEFSHFRRVPCMLEAYGCSISFVDRVAGSPSPKSEEYEVHGHLLYEIKCLKSWNSEFTLCYARQTETPNDMVHMMTCLQGSIEA